MVIGISQKYDFELFDITGRLQLSFPDLSATEFNLSRGDLPAGVYLYRIVTGGEPVGYGKLVIE